MEWLAVLQGKVVGLDTTPLIYFIEENPTYLQTIRPFFEAMDQNKFSVVTSVVTLLEVLVHPLQQGDTQLAQQYREILFNARGLTTITLAMQAGASFFLTNDIRLPSSAMLKVLVLDQLTKEPHS